MQLKHAFGIAAAALFAHAARASDSLTCINDTPPAPSTGHERCKVAILRPSATSSGGTASSSAVKQGEIT